MELTLQFFMERGINPALLSERELIAFFEPLLKEIETLRRIRHLALSYREAEIECTWSFESEPRMRSWHRRLELDALLGIDPERQGIA